MASNYSMVSQYLEDGENYVLPVADDPDADLISQQAMLNGQPSGGPPPVMPAQVTAGTNTSAPWWQVSPSGVEMSMVPVPGNSVQRLNEEHPDDEMLRQESAPAGMPHSHDAPASTASAPPQMMGGPPGVGYGSYIDTLRQAPVMGHAPWWRQLASGTVGAGAGWSNAASRTRNPINPAAAEQEIQHPGYAEKMQEFQSRVAALQPVIGAEAAQRQAWWDMEQKRVQDELRLSEAQRAQAQAQRAQAQAKWFTDRSGKPHSPDELYQHLVKDYGVDQRTALSIAYNRNVPAQPVAKWNPAEVMAHPDDYTPQEVQAARAQFNQIHHGPALRGSGGPKPASQTQFGNVEAARSREYDDANVRYHAAVARANGDPAAIKQAQDNFASEKTMADQAYQRRVATLTGSAGAVPPQQAGAPAGDPQQQQPQIQDGTIIRNKANPKERQIFKGGKWQPLP